MYLTSLYGQLFKFDALSESFSGLAEFVTIYIAEAHPMDKPNHELSGNLDIATHEVLEDITKAAKRLLDRVDGKSTSILVDTMANHASKVVLYTGWEDCPGGGDLGFKIRFCQAQSID